MSWDQEFFDPIILPGRKQPLRTLRDAAQYITKLPKAEHADEWQAAMEALLLVAELDGPPMFARIGIMRALNRGHIREFDTNAQGSSLGKAKIEARPMTDNPRKPFGGKGTMDGFRCELCGAWIEYRDLDKVLAHEGPLPHVDQDRPAVGDRTDRDRKKPPPG